MTESKVTVQTWLMQLLLWLALSLVVLLFLQSKNIISFQFLNQNIDSNNELNVLNSVYRIERKIAEKEIYLNFLKANYAQAVLNFREENQKIISLSISDFEKKERQNNLEKIYSTEYFAEYTQAIEQAKKEIQLLKKELCLIAC